jgi:hypothetical protein
MRRAEVSGQVVLAMLAVLAVAGLVIGMTGAPGTDLPAMFYRAWWLLIAFTAAWAGAGLVAGMESAFYVASIGQMFGLLSLGLEALSAGRAALGVACVAFYAAMTLALKWSSPWFLAQSRAKEREREAIEAGEALEAR